MKKTDFMRWLQLLTLPVGLILVGLVLLVSPDTATAAISTLLGWAFLLGGAAFVVTALMQPYNRIPPILGAVFCFAMGLWLTRSPLALAAGIGRVLGLVLLVKGGMDLFLSADSQGKLLAGITAVVGLILVLLPMTTSRLVFSGCGLVLCVIGVATLVQRLRRRQLPGEKDDIIDAL